MQIVTGRRGEPHVTSRQMQAVYRSFLGDFALLDIGEKLRAEAYSNDIVRVYDGVVSVQGIYAVIAYNQYDEVYIEPVSVGKKRIDTIVLHYTKDNTLDVEDMQLDVVQGEEYTDNPIAPVVPEGGDAWEGTTDIQVAIYDVEVTNFGLTVTPYARMLNLIPTLESIAERIPETVVTGVKGDSEVLYRDGDVNITKANIGLENVDNTADVDKPISTATQTALAGKVDKVAGKGLSTEDYTTADKTKLAGISEGATQTIANPADTATETLSKLEVGGVVYDIPQGASGATELSELTDVNLTDVEDNDILQYDETANKWKNSNALQGSKTATGNPITVTDAAPVNAVNLSMNLEPIQDLHGYDHPWVGGAGKNKLNIPSSVVTTTINGITYTVTRNEGGAVTEIDADGTATADATIDFSASDIPIGNVILTGCPSGGGNNTWQIIRWNDGWGDTTRDNGSGVTYNNTTASNWFRLRVASGVTVSHIKFYPMIRLSTETDSSFAPYTNICPISGRSEVAINRVGKNLIGLGTSLNGFAGNTTFTDSATTVGFYFETKKLPDIITINAINGNRAYYSYYNEIPANGVPFEEKDQTQQTLPRTITVNKNYKYIHIQLSYNETNVTNIQVEQGSTATTYEPYAGKTYTIQIGQDVYGAHYDVTRGKMVVDRGYAVFDGSSDENWSRLGGSTPWGDYTMYISLNGVKYDDGDTTPNIISNYLRAIPFNPSWASYDAFLSKNPNSDAIYTGIKSITTVADWKTYLASNPLQVCYELATPFTIDLTPTQIKMLENTNTITTDYEEDTITIKYQPNNAIGEAVRAVEESYDPEFAVRPVLKKKAFSGTTDSDGSVTLINASDIPSGHKIIPLHITDMTIDGSAGTYFVEYEPYNSGDSVKGYCYFYMSGSQMFPVGKAITGNFYYYELEV